MFTIPGTENLSPAVKYVIAFAIIFLLLALFALILRRLTGSRMSVSQERGRTRQPRLGIVDVYDLDRQRQLILLRRDNVEHLLLVGGPNDVVVETNIVRVPGARLPASQQAEIAEKSEGGAPRGAEGGPARPVIENGFGRLDLPGALSAQDLVAPVLEPMLKPTRVSPGASPPPPVQPAARPSVPRGAESLVPDMTKELEATLRRAQEQQGAPDMPQAPAPPPPPP
ncbi:MAG TPA: flagellar biosynthetic protein FliO, partial [Enterovirga sp.]|nr:flagellar biosynthetic protein FliO [Enterovirga sp.]